jgi:hypothetical protein
MSSHVRSSTSCFYLCFHRISLIVGCTGQPKTFPTGADRETCVCPSKVGARVQGFPRQHGRLHESSGLLSDPHLFLRVPHPLSSSPTLKSSKTVNLTGPWERFSSGTIECCPMLSLSGLPMPSSRCNNVLYIISPLSFISTAPYILTCCFCTERRHLNEHRHSEWE